MSIINIPPNPNSIRLENFVYFAYYLDGKVEVLSEMQK